MTGQLRGRGLAWNQDETLKGLKGFPDSGVRREGGLALYIYGSLVAAV